jgi:SAM-dependent methyltransferase
MQPQSEKDFFDHECETNARRSVGQICSLIGNRDKVYDAMISTGVKGLRVLEYGCGSGSHSLEIARRGGLVIGIDISEVGIQKATGKAAEEKVGGANYLVMDAMEMTFPDNMFGLVIGEGILHHVDLDRSYSEIARVLKPGGRAIFTEALGHDPAIGLLRVLTPGLRTPDEHPLVRADLKLADKYFGSTDYRFFHLTSFAALAFLKASFFFSTVNFFDRIDRGLFRALPPLRLLASYCIMIMSKADHEPA